MTTKVTVSPTATMRSLGLVLTWGRDPATPTVKGVEEREKVVAVLLPKVASLFWIWVSR